MGVVTWLRACEIYPELPDLIVEAERRRLAEQPAKYRAAMAETGQPMGKAA
jgi:hypothetical protein